MTTKVKIVDNVHYDVSREATESEWDRDDTYEDHNVEGIEVVKTKSGFYDVEVGFDILHGMDYYLLYGIYSTGDSFGRDEGRIEFVDLYEDREVAEENAKRLRAHNEEKEYTYSTKLLHESGKEYDYHTPWKGFFEYLSYLEVKSVQTASSRF